MLRPRFDKAFEYMTSVVISRFTTSHEVDEIIDAEVPFAIFSLKTTKARIVRQLQGNFHLARVCQCSCIKAFVLFISHLSHDGRWGIT